MSKLTSSICFYYIHISRILFNLLKITLITLAKGASQPIQPKPTQVESSEEEDDDIPLKTIQKELKTASAEQALYERYIVQRDGKLAPKETTATHQESAPIKRKLNEATVTLTVPEHHQPAPAVESPKQEPKKKQTKLLDAVKKVINSENAADEVSLDTKQPDCDLAANSHVSTPPAPPLTLSDDEGHEFNDIDDWWFEDEYNQSGVEQFSEVINFLLMLKLVLLKNSGLMSILILGSYFLLYRVMLLSVFLDKTIITCSNHSLAVHSAPRL